MSEFIKNKKEELIEIPPYTCKICGLGNIKSEYDICEYCGWEADTLQTNQPDYMGGANHMSLNQYKKFWEENKEKILKQVKPTYITAIELAKRYYKDNFKK